MAINEFSAAALMLQAVALNLRLARTIRIGTGRLSG